MIHQDTELRLINQEMGYGVFAKAFIPKGTIVYVKDPFDIELTPEQYETLDEGLKRQAQRYSYIDERGIRILSWDMAKYVNHRCDCNTMSTGYGFEVAIKDISLGDEITDEYGLFNIESDMPLQCGCLNCRGILKPDDIDMYYPVWDRQVQDALSCLSRVPQPLWPLLDSQTVEALEGYLQCRMPYRSVLSLRIPIGPNIINIDAVKVKVRRKKARVKARVDVEHRQPSMN